MKRTIEIEVPDGKKAVWRDNKVVFEDIKPKLPKTWEEFYNNYIIEPNEYFIGSDSNVCPWIGTKYRQPACNNMMPSKEAAKVMEAYANGEKIQYLDNNKWVDCSNPIFSWNIDKYRIKPKPKYRPFKTQEECWEEMHKHPDFGWIIHTLTEIPANISMVTNRGITFDGDYTIPYQEAFNNRTFTDGTPFGFKEE